MAMSHILEGHLKPFINRKSRNIDTPFPDDWTIEDVYDALETIGSENSSELSNLATDPNKEPKEYNIKTEYNGKKILLGFFKDSFNNNRITINQFHIIEGTN